MNKSFDFLNGELLLIDKPIRWTSFDVVNKIRFMLKYRAGIEHVKVGHAGTLDPLATGLLLVCTGRYTKQIDTFLNLDKEYSGTMTLGATTPSFDLETEIDQNYDISHLNEEDIRSAACKFSGLIRQVPPAFSAIKIQGRRAYRFAREKEHVELAPKEINIYCFEITNVDLPHIEFRVRCSKGTYIRALARDFGECLKSGAYLSSLRRTQIGDFHIDDAINLDQLEYLISQPFDES